MCAGLSWSLSSFVFQYNITKGVAYRLPQSICAHHPDRPKTYSDKSKLLYCLRLKGMGIVGGCEMRGKSLRHLNTSSLLQIL